MRIEFLGVRGSTASPGASFVRYGGHTSCVAVYGEGSQFPTVLLDAGTGIRALGDRLQGRPYDGAILLSHLHWDHVQGLPFFAPGDRDDARVDLYLPDQDGRSGRDLLAQTMSPPAFSIPPEGLRGRWSFRTIRPGSRTIEGFDVRTVDIAHKGGRTFGHRLSDATGSVAYLPDHAPAAGLSEELMRTLQGVDVLIHDAQFLADEGPVALEYGHPSIEDAVALAVACHVGTLVLFHHSPTRTDAALDDIGRWAPTLDDRVTVIVAREGASLEVAAARRRPPD